MNGRVLTGAETERFVDALCQAFDHDSLRMMLKFRLDENLDNLVPQGDFRTAVFNLIGEAQQGGWVNELMVAVADYRPHNERLQLVLTELGLPPRGDTSRPVPPEPRSHLKRILFWIRRNVAWAVPAILLVATAVALIWILPKSNSKPEAVEADWKSSVLDDPTNLRVRFTDESKGNPTGFTWYFGDGSPPSNDANPVHTYKEAGVYIVRLVVDGGGRNDKTSKEAEIHLRRRVIANFQPRPDSGPARLSVQFYDRSVGDEVSRKWDFGDPESGSRNSSTELSPTHDFERPGKYKVTLTVKGWGNDDTRSRSWIIDVKEKGRVDVFAQPNPGTIGSPIKFNVVPTPGLILVNKSVHLEDGTPKGTTKEGKNLEYTYNVAGTFNVTLDATDKSGSSYRVDKPNFVMIRPVTPTLVSEKIELLKYPPPKANVIYAASLAVQWQIAKGADRYVIEVERASPNPARLARVDVGQGGGTTIKIPWDPAWLYRWRVTAVSKEPDSVTSEPSNWRNFKVPPS